MADCIFCKIARKEIPTKVLYEDEDVIAFPDVDPKAPVHVLIIPKQHVQNLLALTTENKNLVAHILIDVVPRLAKELGVADSGFRLVTNTGKDGGQTVPHLHFHFLGGRYLDWPPG